MEELMPLYNELKERVAKSPTSELIWENYWSISLKLDKKYRDVIAAIFLIYQNKHDLTTTEIAKALPGKRGLSLNLKNAPEELQRIICAYIDTIFIL